MSTWDTKWSGSIHLKFVWILKMGLKPENIMSPATAHADTAAQKRMFSCESTVCVKLPLSAFGKTQVCQGGMLSQVKMWKTK